jgi:predicted GNAT family acetyltransferase
MEILQNDNSKRGKFFINDTEGREIAGMYYSYSDEGYLVIEHTEVAEEFEGRGLGRQLLNALVKYARENSIKVIPVCPYAKAVFEKVAEIQDVLV